MGPRTLQINLQRFNLKGVTKVTMSEVEDRRQRTREAYWDSVGPNVRPPSAAVLDAIEVATQVKITDETIEAFNGALTEDHLEGQEVKKGITAALTALGFEVIE